MKRLALSLVLSGALLLAAGGTASAKGNALTQAKVEARGWACFPGDVMIHCVHPNTDIDALVAGELPSVPSLNFALPDGERFLGTEILIRADLGDDERPCRQGTEADGTYEAVDFGGAPGPEYYSCHHNNEVS
ncbi:MAG: hypothetical protein ACRDUY_11035 [Nitriliruptorales bacterium]